MTSNTVIALDAMGGDRAPEVVVAGAALSRERYPKVKFLFYGDERQVKPLLDRYPELLAASELRHTPEIISADLRPSRRSAGTRSRHPDRIRRSR